MGCRPSSSPGTTAASSPTSPKSSATRIEQRRRRAAHRQQGQTPLRHLRLQTPPLAKSLHDSVGKPPQKLPRIAREAHEMNWVDAAKGKVEASCPFDYAARLTEVMLLGIVALRAGKKSTTTAPTCASPTPCRPTPSCAATTAKAGQSRREVAEAGRSVARIKCFADACRSPEACTRPAVS